MFAQEEPCGFPSPGWSWSGKDQLILNRFGRLSEMAEAKDRGSLNCFGAGQSTIDLSQDRNEYKLLIHETWLV
jgi:hypothetical protein